MADNNDTAEVENSGKKITITVKTPKQKQEIELNEDATVKEVFTK